MNSVLQIKFLQDAHEFLIFLINHINEIIVGEQNPGPGQALTNSKSKTPEPDTTDTPAPTWINEIFQVRTFKCRVSQND